MKRIGIFLSLFVLAIALCGCAKKTSGKDEPALPKPQETAAPRVSASASPGKAADLVPDEVWELYAQYGGNMHLDGAWRATAGHTVFGQVYAGMDVVDAIANVKTNASDKPLEDVVILGIDVKDYE